MCTSLGGEFDGGKNMNLLLPVQKLEEVKCIESGISNCIRIQDSAEVVLDSNKY